MANIRAETTPLEWRADDAAYHVLRRYARGDRIHHDRTPRE